MNYLYRFLRIHGNKLRVTVSAVVAVCALTSRASAQVATLLDLENSPAQDYTLYTYSFQAQLAQTFLTFEFRQDPAFWSLDDVSITNSASTQLIVNGGFEGGSYGGQATPNSWTLIGQAGLDAGGEVSGGCAHSGSFCYSDGAVGGVDGLYQSFTTTIGATYSLSFWLANDGGATASAIVQVGASLDNGGVLVPSPPSAPPPPPPAATNMTASGTPYLAAGLGTTLNPAFDGGILQLDSSGPIFNQNFTISSNNGTIDTAGLNSTMSGVFSGLGGLTFMNSGSAGGVTLTNTNTYAGATSINGGAALALSGTGSIAASSSIVDNGIFDISTTTAGASIQSLSGSGAVALGSQNLTLSNAGDTFAGAIGGTGGLALTGGIETLSGVNTFTGATGISSGATLALIGAGGIGGSGVTDNGTFDISGTTAGAVIQALTGGGTVALGGQTLVLANAAGTFSGTIGGTGGLALIGGTQTLTGTNTYTGGTLVSNSTLIIAADAALGGASGALTLNNGTLENTASVNTARSLTLTGSNTLSTDAGATLTQTGQISGNGAVTKVGDGTLVLAGDNRNWGQQGNNTVGGLTINSGLVQVENSNGLGLGLITVNGGDIATTVNILTGQSVLINGTTQLNIGAGTTTTLTGTVEATGAGSCLDKTGAGTLAMSGAVTLSNGACIEQGRFYANGSINSAVQVDSGAMLRGVGTISGAVTVQGTLAPGNSPGTLTVAGNVTMAAGSDYQEDVNGVGTGAGPGNYARLLVTGTANQFIATGATLNVNLVNITGTSTYTPIQPALGDSFRIVTAEGGIVGKFAAFGEPIGLAANTRLAIFYDPFGDNSIDLRVVPTSYAAFLQASGADSNARSAGSAMNQVMNIDQAGHATVAQDELAYTLGGFSAAALPGVMLALAGEVHANLAAVAPQAGQWLDSSVARQLEFSSADGEMAAPLPGQALWLDTTANHGKWDADDRSSGFTTNRSQTAVGFDLLVGHGNRVGVGFSHSLIDVSTSAASGSVDENAGFVYGQYSLAAVIFDGMLGAGTNHWETDRVDPLGLSAATLDTDRRGSTELASAGIRFPWNVGGMDLEPYARTLWQRVARSSFDEGTALDALSGPDYSANGLRTSAGILFGPKNPSPLAALFGYQVNLGVGYDSGNLVHPTVAATLAGTPTSIVAPDIGRTFAQLNLNGTARLGDHTYAYAGLVDEARSGKTEDAGVNVGVRASF
jgi:fibronectin-binding autotransporter adhesin